MVKIHCSAIHVFKLGNDTRNVQSNNIFPSEYQNVILRHLCIFYHCYKFQAKDISNKYRITTK